MKPLLFISTKYRVSTISCGLTFLARASVGASSSRIACKRFQFERQTRLQRFDLGIVSGIENAAVR